MTIQNKAWGLWLHWAWLPVVGFCLGAATIIALLVVWLADGHPRYRSNEATVVYISDVGAANHALFIALGSLTAVSFFLCMLADYRLRHTGRVLSRVRWWERVASALAVIFGFLCALFCILLTIFDAFNHSSLHWTFAALFFVCLLISGLFNMIETTGLYRDYRGDRYLQASFITKLIIIVLGIPTIILFGVLGSVSADASSAESGAAALEWFLTALFAVYILSMAFDLYPSRYTSRHVVGGSHAAAIHPEHGIAPLHGASPEDARATEMYKRGAGVQDNGRVSPV